MRSRSSGVTRSSASSERIQSPVACSIAKFFWAAKPGHGAHRDLVGELAGDLHRLVGGLRVDHHDLVGPRHALEARAQALLLVPGDDGHGQAAHPRAPPRERAPAPPPPPPPARGRPWCRRGSGARGRAARRARCARRAWGRRAPRLGVPSAAARCSGPVSSATISDGAAQQRAQLVEVGGRRQDRRAPACRRRICRAMWTSSGPHSSRTRVFGSCGEPLGQRGEVRDRPLLVGAARAGIDRDQQRRGSSRPARPGSRPCAALRRGRDRHVELDRAGAMPSGAEQGQVLVHHVHRARGRAHAPVGEEQLRRSRQRSAVKPMRTRRAGVGGEQPALDQPLQVDGDVERGPRGRGSLQPRSPCPAPGAPRPAASRAGARAGCPPGSPRPGPDAR